VVSSTLGLVKCHYAQDEGHGTLTAEGGNEGEKAGREVVGGAEKEEYGEMRSL
jgi:hypothetical protein